LYYGDDQYPLYQEQSAVLEAFILDSKKIPHTILPDVERYVREWFSAVFIPAITKPAPAKPVFIAAVGDIQLDRGVDDIMIAAGSPQPVFTDTIPVLANNHITIGNLECAITNRTNNVRKTYTFKGKAKALAYLKDAGFTYLMLTNNHCYDFGEGGFIDTLSALKNAGIATSGAGRNLQEALQFYRTSISETKISIISCGAYPIERSGFNGELTAQATDTRAGILWKSEEILSLIRAET